MVRIVQHSWLGGQLDAEMLGRQDKDKYHIGATKLENFIPIRRGGIRKRPGTNFVRDLTSMISGCKFRLIPLSYLSDYGYAILFIAKEASGDSDERREAWIVSARGDNPIQVTGNIPYTANDLDSLHYTQCGDIVYIAHRLYKPACIRHTESSAFVYEEVRVQPVREGVPTITDAIMTRLKVATDYRGGKKIEKYRVSAVRDGVETVASDPYFSQHADSEDTDTSQVKRGQTHTTEYFLPWTESQEITLSIGNVTSPEPDEVRVYKDTGSAYGLIGIIKKTSGYFGSSNAESGRTKVYSGASDNKIYDPSGGSTFGLGFRSWYCPNDGSGITIDLDSPISFDDIEIGLGCIGAYYAQTSSGWTYSANFYPAGAQRKDQPRTTDEPFVENLYLAISYTNGAGTTSTIYHELPYTGTGANKARVYCSTSGTAASKQVAENKVKEWVERPRGQAGAIPYDKKITKTLGSTATGVVSFNIKIVKKVGTSYENFINSGAAATSWGQAIVYLNNYPLIVNNIRTHLSNSFPGEFVDDGITPDASISPLEEDDVMSDSGDYPASVAVYQQRLVWASSDNDPARIWMSQIGDFSTYNAHEIQRADDAIDFMLPITRFAKLNHIIEMRALLVFSEACEWVVASNSSVTGISAETIDARAQSYIGSDGRLPPIVCNNAILFAERTGEAVRRYGYQLEDDGYGGNDISIFSSGIFNEKRIVDWTYQQFPNSTVWAVLSDGTVASLVFMEDHEQKICAWSTHAFGGNAHVEAVACTHALIGNDGSNRNTSEILMVVRRGTSEDPTYSLEVMRPFPKQEGDAIANMLTMDSVRSLAQSETIPVGMTAVDKATGARVTTVGENGAWAGYLFNAVMTSVQPAISDQDIGAGQFDIKNVQQVAFRLINSVGGSVRPNGEDATHASAILPDAPIISDGNVSTPEKDVRTTLYGSNNRDGRVTVEQGLEWPIMITMMERDIAVEVEGQK